MTSEQFLKQAFRLNELINSDLSELANLRALSTSICGMSNNNGDKVQTSVSGGRIEEIISKIIDLEKEINAEIDRYVDLKVKIRRGINQLENRNECLVLRLRYVEFLSWDEIKVRMGYSDIRRIFQLHGVALTHFKVPEDCCT